MRPFLFLRPVVVASLVLASLAPAYAASVLGAVRVDATPAGGALVSISFNGDRPVYHLVGAGTPETAVIFDGTSLGPVAPSIVGAGPITSVSVAQSGNNSSVALHLTAATGVRIRSGGNAVFVDVAAPTGVAASSTLGTTPAAQTAIGFGPVTEVIALKYADVSEVAGVLSASAQVASNDTFAPVQTGIGTSSLTGSFGGVSGGGGFNGAQPVQSFGGGVGGQFGASQSSAQRVNDNIAVDRRLNAIIVSGTPDVVAGLKALIEKIDVPVRSVILETQIVELTDSASRDIGFDFAPNAGGSIISGSSVLKNQSIPTSTSTIAANLYAQIVLGNAKIIAKPRILAQSGQQASILTGDAIPIITNVVSVGGSTTTSQQVNYVNVGVSLQIEPRVSSDGFVTSHIYTEVSSVSQFVQGIPQISQRTATTTATVRDGEAFVIGGLLQDNEIRNLIKVPFIGDLPLIGSFFRRTTSSHNQTNLYIVITPHIVDPSHGNAPPKLGAPSSLPSSLPQVAPPGPPPSPSASAQPSARPTSKP